MKKLNFVLCVLTLVIAASISVAEETPAQAAATPEVMELVFCADVGGNWDIYRMDLAGSAMTPVTNTTTVNEIWAHCSAINHKCVYVAKETGIHVIGLEEPSMAMQLIDDKNGLYTRPFCSGDEAILTLVKSESSDKDAPAGILMIDTKTFQATPLMKQMGRQTDPAWFRKSKKMLYILSPNGKPASEMWTVLPDGSEAALLHESKYSDMQPDISLDEKFIAFASNREGSYDIWRIDADGSNLVRLTDGQADETEPRWSPDGKRIAFLSNAEGWNHLFLMDSDGGNIRQITTGEFDCSGANWHVRGVKKPVTEVAATQK